MSNAHPLTSSFTAPVPTNDTEPLPVGSLPLCVDLDGTLILTDALIEGITATVRDGKIPALLGALLAGNRAVLKERISEITALDVSLLPYNEELLGFLRKQREAGRRIVLATAADQHIANAIAAHLGIFDEVIASDGATNLKGSAKAEALIARFGKQGFVYAGNDENDLPVWQAARATIIVNASKPVREKARQLGPVEAEFEARPPLWSSALRAMRPHQWVKNTLVVVPMIAAHALLSVADWGNAIILFLAFCATASAIYLLNDLADIEADRQHPRKRNRPIASGALPIPVAVALMSVLLAIGLTLASITGALPLMAIYAAASLAYSFGLKELPLVDVFMLAGLYTIRVLAGGVATGHRASLWLLAFSGFLFLSLALIKRCEEMIAVARSEGERTAARRGYSPDDLPMLQMFGTASAFAATVVLAMFVASDDAFSTYASPEFLWGIVPLILFWQCRLWLSTSRGFMHDDPILYAVRDWVSWVVAVAVLALLSISFSGVISFY
jgi:4-hydroxybenzoate polyprenyltransferase/phosphoserine phosphatase